jgi:hypothetical protein
MTNHSPEYLRRRSLVRWIFWTPVSIASFAIFAATFWYAIQP